MEVLRTALAPPFVSLCRLSVLAKRMTKLSLGFKGEFILEWFTPTHK